MSITYIHLKALITATTLRIYLYRFSRCLQVCVLVQEELWCRILVQVTIYRRLLIGRDGRLDQSKAYDISQLVREYGPVLWEASMTESCVWRAVSSHSSHHPQKVPPAQFRLYMHKRGLKPDFNFS